MSTHAAQLINAVPGIEKKRYLELGVEAGNTYRQVKADIKVGVDINMAPEDIRGNCYCCPTDEYWEGFKEPHWDVVFIDAGHTYEQVLKDYNNAARFLRRGGYIFIHDLIPPDEAHTTPDWCGDGWRFLLELWACDAPTRTLNQDYGLTCVRDWRMCPGLRPNFEPRPDLGSFSMYTWMQTAARVVDLEEMLRWIKED